MANISQTVDNMVNRGRKASSFVRVGGKKIARSIALRARITLSSLLRANQLSGVLFYYTPQL
jgi:hypothetical protein